MLKKQHEGASDIYSGIGANDGTDQQGKSKIADDRSAENIQGKNREENSQRRQDGSAEGFIDGRIDDIAQLLFGISFYNFPNSIQRNNGIINRKTDNENEYRKNVYGEFHVHNRNSSDHNQGIMNQSKNSSHGVAELKAPGNINQYSQPGKNNGNNCLSRKIRTYFRADDFHTPDFIILVESSRKRLFHIGGQHLLIGERFRRADQKFIGAELLNCAVFQFC